MNETTLPRKRVADKRLVPASETIYVAICEDCLWSYEAPDNSSGGATKYVVWARAGAHAHQHGHDVRMCRHTTETVGRWNGTVGIHDLGGSK